MSGGEAFEIDFGGGSKGGRPPPRLSSSAAPSRARSSSSGPPSRLLRPSSASAKPAPKVEYEEGQKVKVKRTLGTGYIEAVIVKKNKDMSYNVKYSSSGKVEMNVPSHRLAPSEAMEATDAKPSSTSTNRTIAEEKASKKTQELQTKPTIKSNTIIEGAKVEANYRGKGKYFSGKITRDRGDGTFDVMYNDGDSELRVKEEWIRLLDDGPAGVRRSNERVAVRLEEGAKVEANYRGKGKYFPGKITRDRGDGTFDVMYDDGDSELRVKEEWIRLLDGGGPALLPGRDSSPSLSRRKARLEEGAKVEANYRGKGKYFSGKITRDRGDGTFDVMYDDGDSELRVKEEWIRLLDDGPAGVRRSNERVAARLEEGAKVEANYRGKGKYFPGKITRDRGDGTFDVMYDDGDSELRVKEEWIRLLDGGGPALRPGRDSSPSLSRRKARLEEGAKVEANYRGKGKYFPGKITRDRGDGTFDVMYDDGDSELRVKEEWIRLLDDGPAGVRRSNERVVARLEEGAKVEANYRGKGKYFPGKITRDRGDGTFDVMYDDGDSELRVKEEWIRLLDDGPAGVRRSNERVVARLEEGAKVEANYRGKGKYFPGKITRDRGDGTFDVMYDDGDSELRVKEEWIRLLDGGGPALRPGRDSSPSLSRRKARLEEGAKVEANYRGKGKYFSGKITRDRGDGTFDVMYDDGDSELRVKEEWIRLLDDGPAGVRRSNERVAARLEEGAKVEANYRGKGKYFPGKITRDRGDGTFDVMYDDGDSDLRVKEEWIRLLDGGGPALRPGRDSSPSLSRRKARLEEGAKVEANYRGKGKYFPGKITRDRGDGTFDVMYDDGDSELRVKEEWIRLLDDGPAGVRRSNERVAVRLEEGAKVEANYRGKGKYFPGKITRDRGDGTFDVMYDDGDSELRVKEEWIRLLDGGGPALRPGRDSSPSLSRRKARLEEGAKVEANYRGKGKYFPGKITRDRGDGTFDVMYDDGDSELRVKEEWIRLLDDGPAGVRRSNERVAARLEEGAKVEANYRGKGKYFPGKITRDRGDGTFDVMYDDGDSELRVKEEWIRLLDGGGPALRPGRDSSPSLSRRKARLEEGAKVEANYRGKGKYFSGKITRDRGDGTFDVMYDDGDSELRVKEEWIRLLDDGPAGVRRSNERVAARLEEGAKVEANYRGKGKYFPGKITRDRGDGTFDVMYDDGDSELRVKEEWIRLLDGGGPALRPGRDSSPSLSRRKARLEEGAKVEANYRGKGKYFSGKITRDRGDGTFDVMYDDGDSELRVKEEWIRLLDDGPAGVRRSNERVAARLEEGAKVEANYRGKGKYFPGKITRDRGDGTFDVMYDDGDSELRVKEEWIRLLDDGPAGVRRSNERVAARLEEGAKVEANYRGKGKYFPGKITRDRGDGTFDVMYDDGDSELRVKEEWIRLLDDGPAGVRRSNERVAARLEEGAKVEANYRGKGKYFPGKITRDRGDGTFDVMYDDGDSELRVKEEWIRLLDDGPAGVRRSNERVAARLEEGAKVEANYRGKGKYFPGKITRDRGDGTFDVMYDDGDSELRVKEEWIRLLDDGPAGVRRSNERVAARLEEGAKVEANYRGKGKYFPGKITRDRGDGTFDVMYDDGDSELRVKEEWIRLLDDGPAGVRRSNERVAARLEEGAKVEANYRGKGKYFPGKITRDRGDGTFDVMYDDGDSELRVKEEWIRLLDDGPAGVRRSNERVAAHLEEGAKVEANYRGKGKYFPGKITRDRGDGTFDVMYDDGDSELRVKEEWIRLLDGGGPALRPGRDSSPSLSRRKARLEEGAKVEANYRGKGKYFSGKITRDRGDGTFDVMYDDGDSELRVKEEWIRLLDDGPAGVRRSNERVAAHLEEGAKVEANYRGKGKYFSGKITRDRGDGTFDVMYDDGDSELRVKEEWIRLLDGGGPALRPGRDSSPSLSRRKARLEEGAKVEANYRGKGKYFSGKITRDRGDGTFDVMYDDGDSELRVKEEWIRLLDDGPAGVRRSNERVAAHLEEGAKVEANYRGKGKYFSGKITRDRGDGTFDVMYDDGDSELRVKEEWIRLLDGGGPALRPGRDSSPSLSRRKARLEEGAKVEANYRGKGKYFSGKITRDRGDGTFDVMYDDGDSELRVKEEWIRLLDDGPAGVRRSNERVAARLEEGAKVEANYRGKGKYFPGKITRDRGDGTFDVMYDDGDSELRVKEEWIRLLDDGPAGVRRSNERVAARLEEGAKVEANYRGKGKYFSGKITRDRGDGTFDVMYDDGDSELRVKEEWIRLLDGGGPALRPGRDSSPSLSRRKARLEEGAKVEANYRGKGKYFSGKITRDRGDGTFDVMYDDGDSELRVKEEWIRLLDDGPAGVRRSNERVAARLEEGAKVEANYRGKGKYFSGKITRDRGDGTFDVMYDDGDSELRVKEEWIRLLDGGGPALRPGRDSSPSLSRRKARLEEGAKVEANYRGKGKYFSGKITRDRGDGTFDVMYDDGDSELRVKEEWIRLLDDGPAGVRRSNERVAARLEEGAKVEANYRGKGKYFPGKITRDRGDGTFDVMYDDGDSELRVKEEWIRLLDGGGPALRPGRDSSPSLSRRKARLEEGAKVEANYRGKGKYFSGKITRDRGDGTFDVMYDDGDSELRVKEEWIRLLDDGPAGVRRSNERVAARLEEGAKVEANYRGKGKYFPGKITRDRGDGTFDVMYDDGDSELRVKEEWIRLLDDGPAGVRRSNERVAARLEEGAKVEANYRGKGKYFPGKITRDRGDGTFDVMYDDGDSELRVKEEWIRLLDGGGPALRPGRDSSPSLSRRKARLEEGAKVEANYRGKGKYFSGKITRDRGDGTFDVMYDDGDSELRVKEEWIRLLDDGPAGVRRSNERVAARLEEGAKVEANYRGKGKYFPGKITRDRGDGTFDVMYDDGDSELRVKEEWIRLLDGGGPALRPGRDSSPSLSRRKARLEEGAKVEANYRGKGKYFSGKITRDRGDGTFDVMYDDGDSELRVKEEWIRLLDDGPAGVRRSNERVAARLEEGAKVEANYRGKGKYFPGKITRDRGDGTFDVMYDDGDSELRVKEEWIRLLDGGGPALRPGRDSSPSLSRRKARLEEGAKVEANYRGKGKYFSGKITRDRGDGTFDVMYDDGDSELRVKEEWIRLLDDGPAGVRRSNERVAARLEEGAKVEANYRGKGKYFPGKITRDRGDGTFDVMYDDGDSELRVKEEWIRLLDGGGPALRPGRDSSPSLSRRKARLEEGAKVEANYRGKGKYFPGKITRDRGDGTFDVMYDDGDSELRVKEEWIRLLDDGPAGVRRSNERVAARLEEGAKVEANYRGKGKYFPGKITRDRGDGTFDVMYDDGDSELRVKEEWIRLLDGGGPALRPGRDSSPSLSRRKARLEEGAKVEANYRGKGKYFSGKITRDRGDGTFDVMYDDGDSELRVKEEWIRLLDDGPAGVRRSNERVAARLEEGAKVEANYRGKGKYFPGKITRDRGDGTFDVMYDDGDSELRVKEEWIRLLDGGGPALRPGRDSSPSLSRRKARLEEGAKVEANYRGKGKYFSGKITRDRGDGTFDVMYNDGDSELRVKEEWIRLLDDGPAGVRRSNDRVAARLEEGAKVEANYRGKGKYFPGKITRDRGDGTFDVMYDDGDSVLRVKEEWIRLLDGGGPALRPGRDSSPSLSRRKARLEEGAKVEANYRGKGKYFSGKITRDRGDGTFDVMYDDGDSELRVKEEWIRLLDDGPAGVRRSNERSAARFGEEDNGSAGASRGARALSEASLLSFKFLDDLRKLCGKYQTLDETCYARFVAADESTITGSVSKRDFKSILRAFHSAVRSARDESFDDVFDGRGLDDLIACLSDNGDGSPNYQTFLAFVFDQNDNEELQRVRDSLAREVVKKKFTRKELSRLFNITKTYSKGYVRLSEMEKVLRKISSKLSTADCTMVCNRFDFNKEGTADYNLLIDWLMDDYSVDFASKRINHQINIIDKRSLERNLEKFADRGVLRSRDFVEAMLESAFIITYAQLDSLYSQMEKETRGRLTTESVLNYLLDMSSKVRKSVQSRQKVLISATIQEDIGKAVDSYLRDSRTSLGYLLYDMGESGQGLITERKFRRLMDKLDIRDYEDFQRICFDCLIKDGKDGIPCEYLLLLLTDYYWRALQVKSTGLDGLAAISDVVVKKCRKGKDIFKLMQSFEGRTKGAIDHRDFEDCLKKLCGSSITRDQILDVKSLVDPNTNGSVDYFYFGSLVQCFADIAALEAAFRGIVKIMDDTKVEYRDKLLGDGKGNALPLSDYLDIMVTIGVPFSIAQLVALASPHTKRNKVDAEQLLSNLKKKRFDASMLIPGRKPTNNDESFGRGLHQKICKARSSQSKRNSLRNALLAADEDMAGTLSKRDLQSCVEDSMELTEEECSLLLENLTSESTSSIDYLHLLLLLSEPYAEIVVDCGSKVISKMLRAGDLVGLRRLCTVMLRKCASYDRKHTGTLGVEFINTVLREECFNLDDKILKQLTKAFYDRDTGGVLYPEMIALLRCCFNGYVLHRVQYFLNIRKKQGYNVRDFMNKYAQTRGKKLDQSKFVEQLISLGIFISDTAISLIFNLYKGRNGTTLDIDRFFDTVEKFEEGAEGPPTSIMKTEIIPLKTTLGNTCEISQQIIEEYDKKLIRALHAAFNLFDQTNSAEVPAVELERILGSVGYFVSFDELQDLVIKIDTRNTGILHYNDFITHAIPFIRSRYDNASLLSQDKLYSIFKKIDESGDGLLQRSELKHILQLSNKGVSKEELDALIQLLDVDDDGDINWDEFKRVFTYLSDNEFMNSLPYNTRSALRKLQYSGLPDPEEYLTMFVGLPFNYRLSVLSDLEKSKNYHALQKEVCGAMPMQPDDHDPAMQFEVQVVRVTGVPSEESFRRGDIVNRCVKFSVCQTDKPPTAGQPGNPPVFLSNVTKLHANIHPQYQDKWQLADKDDLDPDKSCFVRCHAKEFYSFDGNARPKPDSGATPDDQLYLFIELITTFRVSKAFKITSQGLKFKGKMKDEVWDAPTQTIMDRLLRRSMNAQAQQEGRQRTTQESQQKLDANNANNRNGNTTATTRNNGNPPLNNTNNLSAAFAKSLSFFPYFFKGKEESESESDDGRPRAGAAHREQNLRRSTSRSNSPRKHHSRHRRRRSRSDSDDENRRSSKDPQRRRSGRDARDNSDRSGSDSESNDDGDDNEEKSRLVEMCCGWAMIPIAATLRGTARKFRVDMCGGTPFDMVGIKKEEVILRTGAWQTIKRAFGFNVKSVLEILITPATPSFSLRYAPRTINTNNNSGPVNSNAMTSSAVPNVSQSVTSLVPTSLAAAPDGLPWLTKLLPVNIVVPTSSVTIVGIYRKILADTLKLFEDQPDRILPQTGSLLHADVVLSSFPRILADPAACRVLMMLWKKEFPTELNGKTYRDMTINDASSVRALQVFRNVMLRLWHAFGSPDAQPNKLLPDESEEDIIARELRIRELVGIAVGSNPQLAQSLALTKSIMGPLNATANALQGTNALASTTRPSSGAFSLFGPRKEAPQGTLVGSLVVSGANSSAPQALTASIQAANMRDVTTAPTEQLYTPFNPRELMWTKPVLDG